MHKKEKALQALRSQKLLPLYYHESAAVSVAVLQALYKGGIRILEYTNRGDNAAINFRELRKIADAELPGLLLGIGTIKSRSKAQQFIDAGADFIVCPTINTEVAITVQKAEMLWIPGCMTPTEIAVAENAGASVVKIFPGNLLGPSYIQAIKDLFPGLQFMPTGGVEVEAKNLKEWFASGVVAVGMGSKLITKDMMAGNDGAGITAAAAKALQLVKEASA